MRKRGRGNRVRKRGRGNRVRKRGRGNRVRKRGYNSVRGKSGEKKGKHNNYRFLPKIFNKCKINQLCNVYILKIVLVLIIEYNNLLQKLLFNFLLIVVFLINFPPFCSELFIFRKEEEAAQGQVRGEAQRGVRSAGPGHLRGSDTPPM